MSFIEQMLQLWASELRGLYPALVQRSSHWANLMMPTTASREEQTVLGRWCCLVLWTRYHTLYELHIDLEQAPRYWRGMRAVAERRASPTSPLGKAMTHLVADTKRLSQVTEADQMLLSLALADVLDGLAMWYRWNLENHQPNPGEAILASSRASGTLGLFACLGALRGWDLPRMLPSHQVRRYITLVSDVCGLLIDPLPSAEHSQRLAEREQNLDALHVKIAPDYPQVAAFAESVINGTATWAQDDHALASERTPAKISSSKPS